MPFSTKKSGAKCPCGSPPPNRCLNSPLLKLPRTTGLGSNPKRCLSTSRQRTPGPRNHLGYRSYSQSLFDLERNSRHLLKQLGDHLYFQSTGIEAIGVQCLREGRKIQLCHEPQPEEAACCQSDAQRLEGFHLKSQGRCPPGSAQ